VAQAKKDYAEETLLPTEEIIVVPYLRVPPLPLPPAPQQDGRGKLPKQMHLFLAGHPVFWLDGPTRQRYLEEGESTNLYGLRLWLELAARGYVDRQGKVGSVFQRIGWDVADRKVAERIWRYQQGGYDTDMCAFELVPAHEYRLEDAKRDARAIAEKKEAQLAAQAKDANAALREAMTFAMQGVKQRTGVLRDCEARFVKTAMALQQAAQAGWVTDRLRPYRNAMVDAADRWLAVLTEIAEKASFLSLAATDQVGQFDGTQLVSHMTNRANIERRALNEKLMAAVYAHPKTDDPYRNVMVAFQVWGTTTVNEAEAAVRGAKDFLSQGVHPASHDLRGNRPKADAPFTVADFDQPPSF
jgi:hypothetical protein